MGGQRFEGKNLEEALQNAATSLGVDRFRVAYHVVIEKKGFLGGTRRVVIEAELADAPAADEPAPRPRHEPRFEKQRSRGRERGGSRQGGRRDEGRGAGAPRFRSTAGSNRDFQAGDPPEQEAESEAAVKVRAWIERVIDLAGFELVVRTAENDETLNAHFYGPDADELVARDGELLDSLQVLSNKALVGRTTDKPIEFDCGGFKQLRAAELSSVAREAAARVRSEGGEFLLPAMSPVERRLVHLALEDDEEVTTESRGDGFYKRVAVVRRVESPG